MHLGKSRPETTKARPLNCPARSLQPPSQRDWGFAQDVHGALHTKLASKMEASQDGSPGPCGVLFLRCPTWKALKSQSRDKSATQSDCQDEAQAQKRWKRQSQRRVFELKLPSQEFVLLAGEAPSGLFGSWEVCVSQRETELPDSDLALKLRLGSIIEDVAQLSASISDVLEREEQRGCVPLVRALRLR